MLSRWMSSGANVPTSTVFFFVIKRLRCYKTKIQESEKAGSCWESNPGHQSWATSTPLSFVAWYHTISKVLACHYNGTLRGRIMALYLLSRFGMIDSMCGTTAKRPICISGHRHIINRIANASNWKEWRLFEVRRNCSSMRTYCRGWL